jgi:pyruvate,water dikinase
MTTARYVVPFTAVGLDAIAEVGGKNASLGELINALSATGVRVPQGFALTAAAFRLHLSEAGLDEVIYQELDRLDLADLTALAAAARSIRERVAAAPLPAVIAREQEEAYASLSREYGEDATAVAGRARATAEDLPTPRSRQRSLPQRARAGGARRRGRACLARCSPTARSPTGSATDSPTGRWRSVGVRKMVR